MSIAVRCAAELILSGPSRNAGEAPDGRLLVARRPFAGAVPR